MFPTSFSPDGKTLRLHRAPPGHEPRRVGVFRRRAGTARPLIRKPSSPRRPRCSHRTGDYVAFSSNESGREEVYVRANPAYPGSEGRWQISTDGGNEPMWSHDGSELFYRSATSLMVAEHRHRSRASKPTKPRVRSSRPRMTTPGALYANYDVRPDGRNFVMIRSEQYAAASRIHVVLHWLDELSRRVPIP